MIQTPLNECIIAASTFGSDIVLVKNRDRGYAPKLEIMRAMLHGTEIAVLHDKTTGWVEGINEYGMGLVNASLMVGFDEKEKEIVAKSGQKSKDGPRILKALSQKNIDDAVDVIGAYRGGVKGHTFVATPTNGYTIENTSQHAVSIKPLNLRELTVRTNHGNVYPDAGYTHGIKYLSSKIRKISAEKTLEDVTDYHDIARALRTQFYDKHSMLNMTRDTENMKTTSQMVLNLSRKEMLVYLLPHEIESFSGLNSLLPDDYQPTIKIRVFVVKGK